MSGSIWRIARLVMGGPVEQAIRNAVTTGDELYTPSRKAPFVIGRLDSDGITLLFGAKRTRTVLTWSCLEGVPAVLAGREWVRAGSKYEDEATGPLDAYLKGHLKRATSNWVAALLERAGIVEIKREIPLEVRLRR